MRPGLVFISLFAVLVLVYALLRDSLGPFVTFLLQAALVVVVLAGAAWFRYVKRPKGWLFFRDEDDDEDDDKRNGTGGGGTSQDGEPPAQLRKAS